MKKAAALVMAMAFLLIVGNSCSLRAAAGEPVTITYAVIYPNRHDLSLVRNFNQENDDIHVNTIVVDAVKTGDIFDNYLHFLKKDPSTVDVFLVDIIRPVEYALLDLARPLDSFIPPSVRIEFPLELMKACTFKDELFAVPYFVHSGLLYYRKDLLNLEDLDVPSTWDELVNQAGLLSKKYGMEGYVFEVAKYEGLICTVLEFMWSFGGGIELRKNGTLKIDTPENTQALEYMLKVIYDSGVVSDPNILLTATEQQVEEQFISGNAVFARHWPPLFKSCQHYQSAVKDRIGVTTMPSGPAGESRGTLGGWALAINRYSKHPEEAWRFIEYLVSDRVQRARFLAHGDPPARRADDFEVELFAEDFNLSMIRYLMDDIGSRPAVPFYRVISLIFQTYLYDAVTRKMDPEDALRNMELEVNEFLRNIRVDVDIREVMDLVRKNPDEKDMFSYHQEYLNAYSDFLKATVSYNDIQMELFRFLVEKKKYDTFNTCREILDRRLEENMLTVALDRRVTNLDPHRAREDREFVPLLQLYERLCRLNDERQVEPLLAESWSHDDNFTSWVFTLREGVTFHDGAELNAEVVKENLYRLIGILQSEREESIDFNEFYLPIDNVSVLDSRRVEITTTHPTPSLPYLLTHPAALMISPKNLNNWDEGGEDDQLSGAPGSLGVPAGTGPFSFVTLNEEGVLTLKRSEDYRGQKPDIGFLRFISISDPMSRMLHLKHGNVDIIFPVTNKMVQLLEENEDLFLVNSGPTKVVYLMTRSDKTPFDSLDHRSAFVSVMDKNSLASYALRNRAQLADTFLPPSLPVSPKITVSEIDFYKAMQVLETLAAGEDNDFHIWVESDDRQMIQELAYAVQEKVTSSGLNIEVQEVDRQRLQALLWGESTEVEPDFAVISADPYVTDTGYFLKKFFSSGESPWLSRLGEEQEKKLAGMADEPDINVRNRVYDEVQAALIERLTIIPLANLHRTYGKRKEVKGEIILPNGLLSLGRVSIKRRLR